MVNKQPAQPEDKVVYLAIITRTTVFCYISPGRMISLVGL